MLPTTMIGEILDQIKRKSSLLRLLGIFVLTAFLGIFSARGWARSHFDTVADLLEIQHGYEGVSVGYSGFGSLLITLVERRGTFFVKTLYITRDHELLQREFAPTSRLRYPDIWPAHLSLEKILDDRHVRVELIMNSWVLALILFASFGAATSWLIGLSWLELLNRESLEIAIAEKMGAQARQVVVVGGRAGGPGVGRGDGGDRLDSQGAHGAGARAGLRLRQHGHRALQEPP